MRQLILAISGRKGSGKNTVGEFLADYLTNRGCGINGCTLVCSFADEIKNFCINVLGLRPEQCYGTEEEKNSPTEYMWETVHPYLQWKFGKRQMWTGPPGIIECPASLKGASDTMLQEWYYSMIYEKHYSPAGNRTGPMSGRDIMQLFGTELVRQNFGNIWAAATIRKIKRFGRPINIITDNRFPNEVETVLREPLGYIIRLMRSPYGMEDQHDSEAALDNFDWRREKCLMVDNREASIAGQNEIIEKLIENLLGTITIDGYNW